MDDAINLTIALGGYFYLGQLEQWRSYARALTIGKLKSYKQSPAFHNQSLPAFFDYFRRTWQAEKPLPTPEGYGLIPLQPENLTQSSLIDELIEA